MAVNFKVYIPLTGQDQDSPPIANSKYIIVCDGLGGDGSAKHDVAGKEETQKSAYLGSRKLSEICSAFFDENYENLFLREKINSSITELKTLIKIGFDDYLKQNPKSDDSKGGMVFPTTLASAVFKETDDGINVVVLWAGDSRVYSFNENDGLMQLSKDDVEGDFDACFGKDCRMSNCISQDDKFFINYAFYKLPRKTVLFVCSDGCFDFKKTPMHFELDIIKGLFDANELSEISLNTSVEKVLKNINAGDDCTMAGAVFGYAGNELKAAIRERNRPAKVIPLTKDFDDVEKNYEKVTDEKKREIRHLTSENKKLNQSIISQSREFLLSLFREEICRDSFSKNNTLLELSSKTKSLYEPYAQYLIELEKIFEKIKENQKLLDDYKMKFEKLKGLVDHAERIKRVKEGKGQSYGTRILKQAEILVSNNPWFGEKTGYTSEKRQQEELRRNCVFYIEQLEHALSNLKQNLGYYSYEQMREHLGSHLDNVMLSLKNLEDISAQPIIYDEKMLARVLTEEELVKRILPEIKKNGIGKYLGVIDENDYEALRLVHDEWRVSEINVNNISISEKKEKSTEENVKDFENTFLKVHLFKMLEIVLSLENSDKYIPSAIQYQTNLQRLNDIQNSLNSEMDAQRQIWSKYKSRYEAYHKCECIGEV